MNTKESWSRTTFSWLNNSVLELKDCIIAFDLNPYVWLHVCTLIFLAAADFFFKTINKKCDSHINDKITILHHCSISVLPEVVDRSRLSGLCYYQTQDMALQTMKPLFVAYPNMLHILLLRVVQWYIIKSHWVRSTCLMVVGYQLQFPFRP